jgi:HlyD family secretion protein
MRIVRGACGSLLALASVVLIGGSTSADDKPTAKAGGATKAETCKVEKGTIKVEVTLKGVVEAERMVETSIKPKAWTMPMTVKKAVEHGTTVKKGDVLVELDLDNIDRAIKDLKVERALADLAREQAEEELPVLEKLMPVELAAAERSKALADEDLKKFLETDRPLAELSAHFFVRMAQSYLDYARDELKQLEKMYRSKDLTEETEEAILKRTRFQVESGEFQVKTAATRRDTTLLVELPRREQAVREAAIKETLALQKAKAVLPLGVSQKRLALDKLRNESRKSAERLADLEKDREAMTVRAPADGVVYYGKCVRGQWTTAAAVGPKLQDGGILAPGEVLMTVVSARPAFVRATVEEKDLHALHPEMRGKAVPAGYPDLKLPARLVRISTVPQTAGMFDARVDVDLDDQAEVLTPGMAVSVKLVAFRKDDALTVPSTAVFSDDDDETRYVYRPAPDGKPEKRPVKVGKTGGGKTEIIEGLKEGDEILTAKP